MEHISVCLCPFNTPSSFPSLGFHNLQFRVIPKCLLGFPSSRGLHQHWEIWKALHCDSFSVVRHKTSPSHLLCRQPPHSLLGLSSTWIPTVCGSSRLPPSGLSLVCCPQWSFPIRQITPQPQISLKATASTPSSGRTPMAGTVLNETKQV